MVFSKVCLQPKKVHQTKQPIWSDINSAKTADPELCVQFAYSIEWTLSRKQTQVVSVEDRWRYIWDIINNLAMSSFGRKKRRNQDWYEANLTELEPILRTKREALLNYRKDSSVKYLGAFRRVRCNTQRMARCCTSDYWRNLCQNIQHCSDSGNVHVMYEGIKVSFGLYINKVATLKSRVGEVFNDHSNLMEWWAKHFGGLYSTENLIPDTFLNNTHARIRPIFNGE